MERVPRNARRARSATIGAGPRGARGFQIGPKIRVGGTLGKIGQNVKTTIGKAASNPLVDAGLGVLTGGATIPLLAGALGKGISTPNAGVGDVVKGAATGGVAGAAGNGIDSFLSSLMSKNKGTDGGTDWMGVAKGLFSGGGGDGQGSLGALGDLAGKVTGSGSGIGGTSILDDLLMGGTIASGVADKQRAEGFQNKAASYATGNYDANAPLRDQARTMVQDRSTPDLSNIFANPESPYDRARRGQPQLGTRVPVSSSY